MVCGECKEVTEDCSSPQIAGRGSIYRSIDGSSHDTCAEMDLANAFCFAATTQLTRATKHRSCIFVEVRSPADIVSKFRALVGPIDVELAGVVRPDTIRAKYGNSNALNGVHCSDLAESAAEECEYAFRFIE